MRHKIVALSGVTFLITYFFPISIYMCFEIVLGLQDLLVYGHSYKQDVAEHVTEESVIHIDPEEPPTYVSNAYFERFVDIFNFLYVIEV